MKLNKNYLKNTQLFITLLLTLFIVGCTSAQKYSDLPGKLEKENRSAPVTTPEPLVGDIAYEATYIVDGDTFELHTGDRVRLICIDTPEKGEYYYEEATDYLSSLVLDKRVTLIMDVSDTDRYGRLLRYVYVGDTFVNYELVENGYARVARYPPDTAKCDELEKAESLAKSHTRGIWDVCASTGNCGGVVTEENTSYAGPPGGYTCDKNYYNCGSFSSRAEAQKVYELCGGPQTDIHDLDRDNDGLACESLP